MRFNIAVIVSRFNAEITEGLLAGARVALEESGVAGDAVTVVHVPGAFELPITAMRLAESGRYDAVICLGCLIKGDTMHFEYIAEATVHGLMDVSLATAVPIAFGVLTTNTEDQATQRARPGADNKGREVALTAIEMATLFRQMPAARGEDEHA